MAEIPFAEIRAWMFEAALPFWARWGVDREQGGFHEDLDFEGRPTACAFKRTRVICRQIYVFSHAALLGWREGEGLSKLGFDYLAERAWLGAEAGWARRLTRAGEVLDATADLYDLAFALFACAWRYRAAHDPEALARAHATLDYIEAHMRHPGGEGFLHQRPAAGARLQNPHMHLFEACHAAFEASGEQRFLDRGAEIAGLFRARFFDGRTLGEYFTEDWARAPGEEGRIVEPGHHFEWAWILALHQRLTGEDAGAEAEALVAFAETHGVDPVSQVAYNQVRDDGVALDRGSRAWPNTERIKGHLGLFELTGRDPRAAAADSARLLLDRHLAVEPRGSWIDAFDAEGRPTSTTAPASSFYHVFLAFAELLRLEARLTALG